MEFWKSKRKMMAAIGGFLAFMMVSTLISKSVYAYQLPQITVEEAKKRTLGRVVKLQGTVTQGQEFAVSVLPSIRVDTVKAGKGDEVEEGDVLFTLDMQDLQEQIAKQELDIRKLEVQIATLQHNQGLADAEKVRDTNRLLEDYLAEATDRETAISRAKIQEDEANADLQRHLEDAPQITDEKGREEAFAAYDDWVERGKRLKEEVKQLTAALTAARREVEEAQAAVDAWKEKQGNGTLFSMETQTVPSGFVPLETGFMLPETGSVMPDFIPLETGSVLPDEELPEAGSVPSGVTPPETEPALPDADPVETESVPLDADPPETESVPLDVDPPETESVPPGADPAETEPASPDADPPETESASPDVDPPETVPALPDVTPPNSAPKEPGQSLEVLQKRLEEAIARQNACEDALGEAQDKLQEHQEEGRVRPDFAEEDAEKKNWEAQAETLRRSAESAGWAYDDALRQKQNTLKEAQRKVDDSVEPETLQDTLVLNQLELSWQKEVLQGYRKLQEQDGKVTARQKGVVTAVRVSPGNDTPDGAAVVYADREENLEFWMTVPKEQKKYVNQGTQGSLQLGNERLDCAVEYLEPQTDGSYLAVFSLPQGTGNMGESGTFVVSWQSESYPCCVPSNLVYAEKERHYIYVVRRQQGILGEEMVAEKRYVKVLEEGDSYAALEGDALTEGEEVIASSTKEIKDQTVVRYRIPDGE